MSVWEMYEGLQADWSGEKLDALRAEVRAHFERLRRAAKHNDLLAVDLAERLSSGLEQLLRVAPSLPAAQRSAIVGAARYYVADDDVSPDTGSMLGLDDDVLVFNHVAELLGRSDLHIEE